LLGFGAKRDGVINHCFPFRESAEVEGVDGILKLYCEMFHSGTVMSVPRVSQVLSRKPVIKSDESDRDAGNVMVIHSEIKTSTHSLYN
jgi:hypothetical protein